MGQQMLGYNPLEIDGLLVRLAKSHTMFPRLRAEADNKYDPHDPMLTYLFSGYGFQEVLNEDLTRTLNVLVDATDYKNTNGRLSYRRKMEVATRLIGEVMEFERLNRITWYDQTRLGLNEAMSKALIPVVYARPVKERAKA